MAETSSKRSDVGLHFTAVEIWKLVAASKYIEADLIAATCKELHDDQNLFLARVTAHGASRAQSLFNCLCKHGDLQRCEWLCIHATKYNLFSAMSASGTTALHLAVGHGHLELLTHFIDKYNVDLSLKDAHNATLLHAACGSGSVPVVKLLLPRVDVNAVDDEGRTPLMVAARAGHANVLATLVAVQGADIEVVDKNQETALVHAIHSANEGVALTLMGFGATVSHERTYARGRTLLHFACASGMGTVVSKLILAGADISAQFNSDCLHIAAGAGQAHVIQLLLKLCGDEIERDGLLHTRNHSGIAPIHYAIVYARPHVDVVDVLLSYDIRQLYLRTADPLSLLVDGAQPTLLPRGATPAMMVCARGHTDLLKGLIDKWGLMLGQHDAQPNLLHWCCCQGHTQAVKALLELRAQHQGDAQFQQDLDINQHGPPTANMDFWSLAEDETVSCIGAAAAVGASEVVEMLLEAGASTTIPWRASSPDNARKSHTLYTLAARAGSADTIRILRAKTSLDVNATYMPSWEDRDEDGTTTLEAPLHAAARRGHADAVKALLEHPDIDVTFKECRRARPWQQRRHATDTGVPGQGPGPKPCGSAAPGGGWS